MAIRLVRDQAFKAVALFMKKLEEHAATMVCCRRHLYPRSVIVILIRDSQKRQGNQASYWHRSVLQCRTHQARRVLWAPLQERLERWQAGLFLPWE